MSEAPCAIPKNQAQKRHPPRTDHQPWCSDTRRSGIDALLNAMKAADVSIPQAIEEFSVRAGTLSLDPNAVELWLPWQHYQLTKAERIVAEMLFRAKERPVTRAALYDALYAVRRSEAEQPLEKIVDVFVCKLRKKLKDSHYSIHNVYGLGYRMLINDGGPKTP